MHLLLKYGANPNCGDMDERTPLLWAASIGSPAACKVLFEAGAEKFSKDRDHLNGKKMV